MLIIGAGMAGLIAAHHFRRFAPTVLEAQKHLPNNHEALLRFRSPAIGHLTGIPFKPVQVTKAVLRDGSLHKDATLADCNRYSQKVTGQILPRSIGDLSPGKRWIAPRNFVQALANGLGSRLVLGKQYSIPENTLRQDGPVISTIPMPVLDKAIGARMWGDDCFVCRPIHIIKAELDIECDVYQTVYNPSMDSLWYRASLTGRTLIIECAGDDVCRARPQLRDDMAEGICRDVFGICCALTGIRLVQQRLGKIAPVDERMRKAFIVNATQNHNIYSLGRFACWRHTMLDDLVSDLEVIDNIITHGSNYGAILKGSKQP